LVSPKTDDFLRAASKGPWAENRRSSFVRKHGGPEAFPNQKEKTKLSALSAEFNTMKAVSKFVILLSTGVLSTVAAWATNASEQAYLDTCRKDSEVPVPYAVVSPSVGPEYNGAVVQLEFVVSQDGKPSEFAIKGTPDDELARTVVEAVKLWRFLPAQIDGKPVAKRCSLPVKVVGEPAPGDRYAAN
jgi:TonB family protein